MTSRSVARRRVLSGVLGGAAVTVGLPLFDCLFDDNGAATNGVNLVGVLKPAAVTVDWALVEQVVNAAKGVAVPVSQPAVGLDQFLASARLVENRIPAGATWDAGVAAVARPAAETSSADMPALMPTASP
jgi:hypothetical protein